MLPLCVTFLFIWNFQSANLLLEIYLFIRLQTFWFILYFYFRFTLLGFYGCKQCILIKSSFLYLQLAHVSLINILSSSYTLFQMHQAHQAWQDECGVIVIHWKIITVWSLYHEERWHCSSKTHQLPSLLTLGRDFMILCV